MAGEEQPAEEDGLPSELQELSRLFSAFLSSLTLHHAHHGTLSPADLRLLNPTIARTWGKRSITTEDIQRVLGVLHFHIPSSPAPASREYLHLSDYGSSKICVELDDHLELRGSGNGILGRPLDEALLYSLFVNNLTYLWTAFATTSPHSPPADLLPTLPLLPIHPCASLSKLAPLHARGQRHLQDFKASAAAAALRGRNKENTPLSASRSPQKHIITKPTRPPVTDRRQALKERIKAKSLLQSSLPEDPETTPAHLARLAALDRLPHLTRVLAHLSHLSSSSSSHSSPLPNKPRTTILLPLLLTHLRSNLSHTVSAREGEDSIQLLAEIAPEWVEIATMGDVKGVVIKRSGALSEPGLHSRIESARRRRTTNVVG